MLENGVFEHFLVSGASGAQFPIFAHSMTERLPLEEGAPDLPGENTRSPLVNLGPLLRKGSRPVVRRVCGVSCLLVPLGVVGALHTWSAGCEGNLGCALLLSPIAKAARPTYSDETSTSI